MPDDLSGKISLDTTDFKTALTSLNRELRVLESGFRASAAGLGDWAKDATGLELRIKSLNGQIDVQKQKVEALEAEYKRVAAEKGENSRAAQELQIKLNKETETLGKMEAELDKTEKALSEMGDESGDAAKQTDKLEKEEKEATGSTNKFKDALNGLKDRLGAVGGGLKNMAVGVGKVVAGLAVGLTGAAVGAAAGVGALLVKTAAYSDELVEEAEKLGITTTRLQELNYIGEQTGTGVDAIRSSMGRMIRSLEDIERAGSPASEAFNKLGISVRDSNGQLLDSEEIFFNAIGALSGIENATERDAIAMELFGKSAMELNPLINLGAEGLASMTAEAHSLGAVMGEEAVTGMADLNDAMAGLKAGFNGIVGTLATAFLPMFETMIALIKNNVVPWLQQNLPKAIQVLRDYWIDVLFPAVMKVWLWLRDVLIPFFQNTVYPWLKENIPAAIQVLSDFWTNTLQPAIRAVWNWMSTVLMPFLQNTVYPWLKENIPAAIRVLSDFWTTVLKPAIETVWNWMSTVLIPFLQNTVYPWLQEHIPAAIQTLSDFWTKTLQPAIEDVWNFIDQYLMPIFEEIKDIFEVGLKIAIEGISKVWKETLQPALEDVWDFIDKYVMPIFNDVKDFIQNDFGPAIGNFIRNYLEWLLDKLSALHGWLEKVRGKAKETTDAVEKAASGGEGESGGGGKDKLASGGPVLAGLSYLVGERGPELFVPNVNGQIIAASLTNTLRNLSSSIGGLSPGQAQVHNSWSYIIQAANPLQTGDDLVRQVRLLELMHG